MSASKLFISLSAIAMAVVMAGCGGSGSNPAPPVDVPINGGITPTPGGATDSSGTPIDLPAGGERTIATVINGTVVSDVVLAPNSTTIPSSVPLAVFPSNVPIIEGFDFDTEALTRDPGQIRVNGQILAGAIITQGGRLSRFLAFGPGEYEVSVDGPFRLKSGSKKLTVRRFTWRFQVNAAAETTFPLDFTGKVPVNNGTTFKESFISFKVPASFANGRAQLKILKSNGNLDKTVNMNGRSGLFNDLFNGSASNIPSNGVNEVYYRYFPN